MGFGTSPGPGGASEEIRQSAQTWLMNVARSLQTVMKNHWLRGQSSRNRPEFGVQLLRYHAASALHVSIFSL
ncbi:hypothetical protein B484DRAFT_401555 [Ochromonadaceae sp. CCMP2298]|nr:hypothetical protein B484DRAFT_401555 [Ochromonadaceae sp. CCMP2298]